HEVEADGAQRLPGRFALLTARHAQLRDLLSLTEPASLNLALSRRPVHQHIECLTPRISRRSEPWSAVFGSSTASLTPLASARHMQRRVLTDRCQRCTGAVRASEAGRTRPARLGTSAPASLSSPKDRSCYARDLPTATGRRRSPHVVGTRRSFARLGRCHGSSEDRGRA